MAIPPDYVVKFGSQHYWWPNNNSRTHRRSKRDAIQGVDQSLQFFFSSNSIFLQGRTREAFKHNQTVTWSRSWYWSPFNWYVCITFFGRPIDRNQSRIWRIVIKCSCCTWIFDACYFSSDCENSLKNIYQSVEMNTNIKFINLL